MIEDGVVYHTYSAFVRGLDGPWSIYQWLDLGPLGRNESGFWMMRHDEFRSAMRRCRFVLQRHLT